MKSICVFCGSSAGGDPVYVETARLFGALLAERGIELIYGGGQVGLMGVIADAVLGGGGRVVGVIPRALMDREVGHLSLSELHVVGSMHERKAMMAERSGGFVAMPGGIGTYEELFEVWTWGQLGIHAKPCAILNVRGFYDQLLAFLAHSVREKFLRQQHFDMLIVANGPVGLLDAMSTYEPPNVEKWLDRRES